MSVVPIAVALIRNGAGQVLLVRKYGTVAFMQPGGKPEPGENARAALMRELREELDIAVDPRRLQFLGTRNAPAANEPGMTVMADIFDLHLDGSVKIGAEIAEALWVDPADPEGPVLAPLTRDHILPLANATVP